MKSFNCSVCGQPAVYVADGAYCAPDMLNHLKAKLHNEMLTLASATADRRIKHQAALVHTAVIGNYFDQAEAYLAQLEQLTRGQLVWNYMDCLEWIRQAAKVRMEMNAKPKPQEVNHE